MSRRSLFYREINIGLRQRTCSSRAVNPVDHRVENGIEFPTILCKKCNIPVIFRIEKRTHFNSKGNHPTTVTVLPKSQRQQHGCTLRPVPTEGYLLTRAPPTRLMGWGPDPQQLRCELIWRQSSQTWFIKMGPPEPQCLDQERKFGHRPSPPRETTW